MLLAATEPWTTCCPCSRWTKRPGGLEAVDAWGAVEVCLWRGHCHPEAISQGSRWGKRSPCDQSPWLPGFPCPVRKKPAWPKGHAVPHSEHYVWRNGIRSCPDWSWCSQLVNIGQPQPTEHPCYRPRFGSWHSKAPQGLAAKNGFVHVGGLPRRRRPQACFHRFRREVFSCSGIVRSAAEALALSGVAERLCFSKPVCSAQKRKCYWAGNKTSRYITWFILRGQSTGRGKFLNDLKEAVRKVLAEKLVIIDSEPPGLQAEWAVARRQAKHFLHMILQCEDETPHAKRSRTRFIDDFVAFFPGPWTGLGWVSVGLG